MAFFQPKNYNLYELLEKVQKKMKIKGQIEDGNLRLVCVDVKWHKVKDVKLKPLPRCGAAPISVELGTTVVIESGHVVGLNRTLILPLRDFPQELQSLVGRQIEIDIGERVNRAKDTYVRNSSSLRQNCEAKFECNVRLEGNVKFTSSQNDRQSVDELDASEIPGGQRPSKKKKVKAMRPFSKKLKVKGTCTFHLGQN